MPDNGNLPAYARTELYCWVTGAHVCMNDWPRVAAWTCDQLIASPAPWPLCRRTINAALLYCIRFAFQWSSNVSNFTQMSKYSVFFCLFVIQLFGCCTSIKLCYVMQIGGRAPGLCCLAQTAPHALSLQTFRSNPIIFHVLDPEFNTASEETYTSLWIDKWRH